MAIFYVTLKKKRAIRNFNVTSKKQADSKSSFRHFWEEGDDLEDSKSFRSGVAGKMST